jgi:hypothetical protein
LVNAGIPPPGVIGHIDLAQGDLAQAAKLGSRPSFQADATHLELAYRVHRILSTSGQGELAIPRVDREAVRRRFVDEVFSRRRWLQFCLNPLWFT